MVAAVEESGGLFSSTSNAKEKGKRETNNGNE
jgi:hypothetical protein